MTTFKDMPLSTTLQVGDVVTITGPGEHDVLVREVTSTSSKGAVINGLTLPDATLRVVLEGEGRILTRIQRPVPALPTVEGDYILTTPGAAGHRIVVTLAADGRWLDARGFVEDHVPRWIEKASGIVRVIPADEVKRPAADVEAATSAFLDLWVTPNGGVKDDFETVLRRVLKGEFDL